MFVLRPDDAREVAGSGAAASGERDRVLLVTRHFARHRSFYRAMMTGSCGFALSKALTGMLFPVNQPLVRLISGVPLGPEREADLATFVVGGWNALFSAGVIEASDPLDPDAFADKVLGVVSALVDDARRRAAIAAETERRR